MTRRDWLKNVAAVCLAAAVPCGAIAATRPVIRIERMGPVLITYGGKTWEIDPDSMETEESLHEGGFRITVRGKLRAVSQPKTCEITYYNLPK